MTNDNNAFRYNYSAAGNKEIEAIRQKYLPREESKIEKLRRMDRRVQSTGVMLSLVVGILGALIFGVALCMGLDVLAGGRVGAILLSLPGAAAMLAAYPICAKVTAHTKARLAPEILRLADEISAEHSA
ncbi:MAG: hypothetical protein IJX76_06480 [Clostridia bacterium]|nr:hypothetical protein [Clostridia bacterium]